MKHILAHEIRALHRRSLQEARRAGLVDITGKVKPGSQDMTKRTVQLVLGTSRDGSDVLSPPVRWQATGAGALKMHAMPADNEQMVLHSPSGTIGSASLAHWGTYDKDNAPPSQSKTEAVLQFGGKAQITFGSDYIQMAFGTDQYVKIKDSGDIVLCVPDKGKVYAGDPSKGGLEPVMMADQTPSKDLYAKPA